MLKRLGASALPRWGLLLAKSLAVLIVLLLQAGILVAVGLALGWRPHLAGVLPALAAGRARPRRPSPAWRC